MNSSSENELSMLSYYNLTFNSQEIYSETFLKIEYHTFEEHIKIYVYIYAHTHKYIYIYIYIYA